MSPALKSLGQGTDIQFISDNTDVKISPFGIDKLFGLNSTLVPINTLFM